MQISDEGGHGRGEGQEQGAGRLGGTRDRNRARAGWAGRQVRKRTGYRRGQLEQGAKPSGLCVVGARCVSC